jgi:hypothetical protein
MPQTLEYAQAARFPRAGIFCVICGVLSGPAALVAGVFADSFFHTDTAFFIFAGSILAITTCVCLSLRLRLQGDFQFRARLIATIGLLLPLAYGILLTAFLLELFSELQ